MTIQAKKACISLRSRRGYFFCSELNKGGRIVCNRRARKEWESFLLINNGDGTVSMKAANGKYICAEGGGGGVLVANRDKIGSWEKFVIKQHQGSIGFQASNGQFICTEDGGGSKVTVNRNELNIWESFLTGIYPPDNETINDHFPGGLVDEVRQSISKEEVSFWSDAKKIGDFVINCSIGPKTFAYEAVTKYIAGTLSPWIGFGMAGLTLYQCINSIIDIVPPSRPRSPSHDISGEHPRRSPDELSSGEFFDWHLEMDRRGQSIEPFDKDGEINFPRN